MTKKIFITGTGTDVGKTYISALIVKKMRLMDFNCGYYKPVMSGVYELSGHLADSDTNYVVRMANIPTDAEKPFLASGIRIGTPALTTRGFMEEDMVKIAELIDKTLSNPEDKEVLDFIKSEVIKMCEKYPLNY